MNCGILDVIELENDDNTVEKTTRRIVENLVNGASVVKFLWNGYDILATRRCKDGRT